MNLWSDDEIFEENGEKYLNKDASLRVYDVIKGFCFESDFVLFNVDKVLNVFSIMKNNLDKLISESNEIDKVIYIQLKKDFPNLNYTALFNLASGFMPDSTVDLVYNCIVNVYSNRISKKQLEEEFYKPEENRRMDEELSEMISQITYKNSNIENIDYNIAETYTIKKREKPHKEKDRKNVLWTILAGAGVITFLYMTFVEKHNAVEVFNSLLSACTNKLDFSQIISKVGNLSVYYASILLSFTAFLKKDKVNDENKDKILDLTQ